MVSSNVGCTRADQAHRRRPRRAATRCGVREEGGGPQPLAQERLIVLAGPTAVSSGVGLVPGGVRMRHLGLIRSKRSNSTSCPEGRGTMSSAKWQRHSTFLSVMLADVDSAGERPSGVCAGLAGVGHACRHSDRHGWLRCRHQTPKASAPRHNGRHSPRWFDTGGSLRSGQRARSYRLVREPATRSSSLLGKRGDGSDDRKRNRAAAAAAVASAPGRMGMMIWR